ncbi:endonuclease [Massilia sp. WF1]|uniref:endonuclease/exonuclease/phosphatase family protein n=1 Tax=unclassified Massilia TaxID=2609279 RepID=UPI00064B6D53|nr:MULTISPECIES: endonuclease/exonuclease/phosphatase family protein [unclassified Massilia]ALK96407.1 endonuclease [Massilia sp. WG5]KLU37838.1 endonuclease [Massilia sp. WF1]
MRTILSPLALLLACAILLCTTWTPAASAAPPSPAPINVATYNLRNSHADDGPNAWPARKDMVKALIRYHGFDIFGTQEGYADQIADLAQMEEFEHVGVGRDDGKDAGEHSAIFFRRSRFALLGKGDFWLSETPDRPSFGWDARCCHRLASWARLRERGSSRVLFVFSVHFDHEGEVARRASADLMLRKITEIARGEPAICVGDFNSTPETVQMQTIAKAMGDSRRLSKAPPYGPDGTFNGFRFDQAPSERIDYVFVDRHFDVLKYAALSDSLDQRYPSDHFPVVARVVFK